ncbi:MAG: heme-binding domain-containing protein [Arcobacteraceae bacterium]|jgi:hypothetical protein|nr:heme-binding domain-containing protein [Arcobacteraceae bacterium]
MKGTLFVFIVIILAMQFIPAPKSNPTFDKNSEFVFPKEMEPLIKHACYDCHSYETKWPWYSYIAPMSYSVSKNVTNARAALNFSIWQEYDEDKQYEKIKEFFRTVYAPMPPRDYIRFHSEADLSVKEREMIRKWLKEIINNKEESVSK